MSILYVMLCSLRGSTDRIEQHRCSRTLCCPHGLSVFFLALAYCKEAELMTRFSWFPRGSAS